MRCGTVLGGAAAVLYGAGLAVLGGAAAVPGGSGAGRGGSGAGLGGGRERVPARVRRSRDPGKGWLADRPRASAPRARFTGRERAERARRPAVFPHVFASGGSRSAPPAREETPRS